MLHIIDKGYLSAKNRIKKFFSTEKGEVNVVAIVVLIGVAIVLAGIFKEQISLLLTTLIGKLQGKAETTAW